MEKNKQLSQENNKTAIRKKLKGKVASNKMEKTLVVETVSFKIHPKYRKRYAATKKYKVHVEDSGQYRIGDKVVIEESRPVSKEKRWVIAK